MKYTLSSTSCLLLVMVFVTVVETYLQAPSEFLILLFLLFPALRRVVESVRFCVCILTLVLGLPKVLNIGPMRQAV